MFNIRPQTDQQSATATFKCLTSKILFYFTFLILKNSHCFKMKKSNFKGWICYTVGRVEFNKLSKVLNDFALLASCQKANKMD